MDGVAEMVVQRSMVMVLCLTSFAAFAAPPFSKVLASGPASSRPAPHLDLRLPATREFAVRETTPGGSAAAATAGGPLLSEEARAALARERFSGNREFSGRRD